MEISVPFLAIPKRRAAQYIRRMNVRIPSDWLYLAPGDRIATTMPYHRIQAAISKLATTGLILSAEPSAKGYWIKCERRPAA